MCRLHSKEYEGKWVVLFFYPKDFTFVCPTEIIAFSDHVDEFKKRGAEVIGASCDSAEARPSLLSSARAAPLLCCVSCSLGIDILMRSRQTRPGAYPRRAWPYLPAGAPGVDPDAAQEGRAGAYADPAARRR